MKIKDALDDIGSIALGSGITKKNKNFRGLRIRKDKIRLGPKTDDVKIGNYNLRKMRRRLDLCEDAICMLIERVKRLEVQVYKTESGFQNHDGTPVGNRRVK